MQSRAQHAYLALRSLSFLPQHADRPVAVLTGTGLRSLMMAYAVKRLVGPPPGPMLALLLIFHAVCPVAVITGTGLLAHNGSRS